MMYDNPEYKGSIGKVEKKFLAVGGMIGIDVLKKLEISQKTLMERTIDFMS